MGLDLLSIPTPTDCTVCEDSCTTDGCKKLVILGPCSTIINADGSFVQPSQMIFDINTWCRVKKLNTAVYNPNMTIRKKGYVGECFEHTKAGRKRPTIDLDYDFCKSDESHCMLVENGCLTGFMMMDNREDFKENIPPTQQSCIRYGIARIEGGSESATFDEDDTRSATLHIHRVMWEFNLCGYTETPLIAAPSFSDEDDKELLNGES